MLITEGNKIKKYKSNLKRIRIYRGYTQEELSKASGVNLKSIASYEQNPEKLSSAAASTVYRIADALGVDMVDLLNKDML